MLMREGICESAALRCEHLRSSPLVQESCSGKSDNDPVKEEVRHLIDLLLQRTRSFEMTSILSTESLCLLFPEGRHKELLTDRRRLILEAESMSESTLTRREFSVCAALLLALGVPMPAEARDREVDSPPSGFLRGLVGEWFALWETTVHGVTNFNMERVWIEQRGERLAIGNHDPSPHNPEGYLWEGTLDLLHENQLHGSYKACESRTGWSGALFYLVGGSETFMEGRWAGANVDESLNSGRTVLAREQEVARRRFALLVGGSMEIPRLD
jgi:hypothetical protein